MIYYVEVTNYSRRRCKRTILLNSSFSKEEIRKQMEKEHVDEDYIREMEKNGVFVDHDISFTVKKELFIYWEEHFENGKRQINKREFARTNRSTYQVTFTTDERLRWKRYFTTWGKITYLVWYFLFRRHHSFSY